MVISSYYYFYGAGTEPNRRIDFERTSSDPSSLQAKANACYQDTWVPIGSLSADDIRVELDSTARKIEIMMEARKEKRMAEFNIKKMSELKPEEQDAILKRLEPKGSMRLEITNSAGSFCGLESVSQITIFDPT